MVDRTAILVTVAVAVITILVTFQGAAEVADQQATIEDYCSDTYGEEFEKATFDSNQKVDWHCELENGTRVDVPDHVLS